MYDSDTITTANVGPDMINMGEDGKIDQMVLPNPHDYYLQLNQGYSCKDSNQNDHFFRIIGFDYNKDTNVVDGILIQLYDHEPNFKWKETSTIFLQPPFRNDLNWKTIIMDDDHSPSVEEYPTPIPPQVLSEQGGRRNKKNTKRKKKRRKKTRRS